MGTGSNDEDEVVSSINVTPLVDVMLVLLIIFMVSAGVQNVQMQAQQRETLEKAERMLEKARQSDQEKGHQKVDVDLPHVDNEKVNIAESKKLKLTITSRLVFSLDGTELFDCLEVSPEMEQYLRAPEDEEASKAAEKAFEPCLEKLGEKLVDNRKLQEDEELYVLADRRLDYGKVLRVMAAVRQSGVTKFGLVARPQLLGDATVEPTPEKVP